MLMLDDHKRQNDLIEFLGQLNETQKEKKTKKVSRKKSKSENKCVCTKRYFKKWENRLKLKYIAKLAIPKPVRLRPWPNPELEAVLPIPVVNATLTGKIPSRIYKLAVPKIRSKVTKDVVYRTTSSGDAKYQYSKSKQLLKTHKRILELAEPKPKIRHVHARCLKSEFPERLYMKSNKTSIKNTSDDWIKHQNWLKKNAAPKRIFRRSPEVKRRSKLSKSQTDIMLDRLSQMPEFKRFVKKLVVRTTEPRPFGQITPMGLDWVQRLSVPRKLSSETQLNLDYDPGIIPRAALNAVLTPRIKELAEPKFNVKTVNTEFKENAFKISPTALTYKATKRIKKLAMPRVH